MTRPAEKTLEEKIAAAQQFAAKDAERREAFDLIGQLEESFTADGTYQQFLPAMRAYLAKAGGQS